MGSICAGVATSTELLIAWNVCTTMVQAKQVLTLTLSLFVYCCRLILSSRLEHVMALLRPWCRHGQVEIHNDLRHRSFSGRMAARSETREAVEGEAREAKKRSQKGATHVSSKVSRLADALFGIARLVMEATGRTE